MRLGADGRWRPDNGRHATAFVGKLNKAWFIWIPNCDCKDPAGCPLGKALGVHGSHDRGAPPCVPQGPDEDEEETMNNIAYAVMHIDTVQTPPVVVRVEIYSCSAAGVTSINNAEEWPFDICARGGDDFGDAILKLVDHLETHYPWAYAMYKARR